MAGHARSLRQGETGRGAGIVMKATYFLRLEESRLAADMNKLGKQGTLS